MPSSIERDPGLSSFSGLIVAFFCLLGASLSLGCGSHIQVQTSYDKSKDFAGYRTFAMLQPNKPVRSHDPYVDPFVLQRLRQITYSRLLKRGLRPVPRAEADLVVHVVAGVQERLELNSSGYYGYGFRGPAFSYNLSQYQEGTVIIDFIDVRANSVVWRGAGVRRVMTEVDNEELGEVIDTILSRYPPPPARSGASGSRTSEPRPAE